MEATEGSWFAPTITQHCVYVCCKSRVTPKGTNLSNTQEKEEGLYDCQIRNYFALLILIIDGRNT